ncbi:MAG: nucleotide sugar dehydrogenase [Candidatus Methanosuratincola sp.]
MKITVLGLGRIGLPTSLLLASNGNQVVGVDIDQKKIKCLSKGKMPFFEPGLEDLFLSARPSFKPSLYVEESDAFLIAVPTPLDCTTYSARLSYVKDAANMLSPFLRRGNAVILESTVPPKTTAEIVRPILEKSGLKAGRDFYLAHCPERAIPGKTIQEMIHNDRIIGGINQESAEFAKRIYSTFVKGKMFLTDLTTAEFVKLMENIYRDVNIALVNELAQLAEELGVNVWEAIDLANRHPRVHLHKPGPGVGGYCIPIDSWFIIQNIPNDRILSMARRINDFMPNYILFKAKRMLNGIRNPRITVFGVAYKGNVDDSRESPATKLIRLAENDKFEVRVYDPVVKEYCYPLSDLREAVENSDLIILITDHDAFMDVDPGEVAPLMRNRNLMDTRNLLDHQRWRDAGFNVYVLGVGRDEDV